MIHRWWNRTFLMAIVAMTAFTVIVVWPSAPDRYLPNFVPWPEGHAIPFQFFGKEIPLKLPVIRGGTFGVTTLERTSMSLGLDLRGGTRLVLEPDQPVADPNSALEGAKRVIERRVNEFGVAEAEVTRLGENRIAVQLPGINSAEAIEKIGRTALLQFCEPLRDAAGNVATFTAGAVPYESQTCNPQRDDEGNVIVTGGEVEFVPWASQASAGFVNNPTPDQIIWQPATAMIGEQELALDGTFLQPNTSVDATASLQNPAGLPTLFFQFNGDGADIAEQVTERMSRDNLPLAPFLDGEPILGEDGRVIAPTVQAVITSQGTITGLSLTEARDLSTLLNTGAFPVPLRIVQQQDVDATLGDTAVRNSVIAGEIALLLIMAFMILYYRLPGLMASLALVVYTSLNLAVFKIGLPGIGPIVLTLGGVAAFVLSVGIAVDANILIFERMKEELRVGRNLVVALEHGFDRAWSSIRDSNISTFITCIILYWFGNQFDASVIKGFAIVLAIGVALSMFSAIVVTRTFMRVIVSSHFIASRLWLFVSDLPADVTEAGRRTPAVAGGSDDG